MAHYELLRSSPSHKLAGSAKQTGLVRGETPTGWGGWAWLGPGVREERA